MSKTVFTPSDADVAWFHQHARNFWEGGQTTFGQSECLLAKLAALNEVMPKFQEEFDKLPAEKQAKVLTALYKGSNANAINNYLHGRGHKVATVVANTVVKLGELLKKK